MGKKILLWLLAGASLMLAFREIYGLWWETEPLWGIVITFGLMILITRLVFDSEFSFAPSKRTFFLYLVSGIVCTVFFFSLVVIVGVLKPELSAFRESRDPNAPILQEYQKRLADLRGESSELQKQLDEEARAKAFEEEWAEKQIQSDETVVSEQEKTLLLELSQMNEESLAGTAIVIDKEDGDFLRGRVVFAAEPRKNSIFFARQRDDSGKWEIYHNQMNDGLDCDGYEGSEIEIPKSMLGDCIKYEKDGKIRAADGWKLTNGDPNQDCSSVEYSGEVEVDAWFEWRNSYVEKTWMLAVADNDRPKLLLGWPWKPYFSVSDISNTLRAKLMSASPEKPAKVTVKKMRHYCEGAPWLEIE